MTIEDLHKILSKGESLHLEFKEARIKVPNNFYDTVVSFLNREGGTIILGANDDGVITGIDKNAVDQLKKRYCYRVKQQRCHKSPGQFPYLPTGR